MRPKKKKKSHGKLDTGDRKGEGGCDEVDLSHSALTLWHRRARVMIFGER